jgi:hypothetical protein
VIFLNSKGSDIIAQNKVFSYLALATGLILSIPLLANWPWTLSDFVVMGALIFGFASIFVLAARKFRKRRVLIGIVILSLFLWLWVELAVGLLTNWGS